MPAFRLSKPIKQVFLYCELSLQNQKRLLELELITAPSFHMCNYLKQCGLDFYTKDVY